MRWRFLGAMIAGCFGFHASAAFLFQNIADTSATFQQITTPSVGNDGTVVFQATLQSGVSGIYAWKGGQLRTIADTTQGYTAFGTIPGVNGRGDVAFSAQLPDGSTKIYRVLNGVISAVASGYGLISPSLNDNGLVAFFANPNVYVADGTMVKSYNGQYLAQGGTAISNSGLVAFTPTSTAMGTLLTDGTHFTSLMSYTGTFGFLAMNNLDEVAITTSINGNNAIVVGDAKSVLTIATDSLFSPHDGFTAFYNTASPAINDDGLVLFHPYSGQSTAPVTEELCFGDDWKRVVGTGDSLFGSTIATGQGSELFRGFGLQTARSSFAGDEVVFRYYLANGVQGVAVAYVPEPTGGIATVVLWGTLFLKRSRNSLRSGAGGSANG